MKSSVSSVAALLALTIAARSDVALAQVAPQGAATPANPSPNGRPITPPKITLAPDDVRAVPDAPAGFDVPREGIAHGKLEMIEYDSKSVGTRRRMNVYTPPGYSSAKKYPVLYL